MTSNTPENITQAAVSDAVRIEAERTADQIAQAADVKLFSEEVPIGLTGISEKEARKLESEEHKALGYRPPKGSIAAEAQSVASKSPEASGPELNRAELRGIAQLDAARVELEQAVPLQPLASETEAVIGLGGISEKEARKLESEEQKALGYRPPAGSLAAEAKSEAAKHPEGAGRELNRAELREVAQADAVLVEAEQASLARSSSASVSPTPAIDLDSISEKEARKLMSEEHKILGHRPPPGSLAAEAQSAAAKHPEGKGVGREMNRSELREVAIDDAVRIEQEEVIEGTPSVNGSGSTTAVNSKVDLEKISAKEARKLMSEEHKILGYRPPPGSLAAEAQSAAAKHPDGHADGKGLNRKELREAALEDAARIETERASKSPSQSPVAGELDLSNMTKDEARELQSEEQRILGYRPPRESIAAAAQSVVDSRDAPRGITV